MQVMMWRTPPSSHPSPSLHRSSGAKVVNRQSARTYCTTERRTGPRLFCSYLLLCSSHNKLLFPSAGCGHGRAHRYPVLSGYHNAQPPFRVCGIEYALYHCPVLAAGFLALSHMLVSRTRGDPRYVCMYFYPCSFAKGPLSVRMVHLASCTLQSSTIPAMPPLRTLRIT